MTLKPPWHCVNLAPVLCSLAAGGGLVRGAAAWAGGAWLPAQLPWAPRWAPEPLRPRPQSVLGLQGCTRVVPQLWLKHGEPKAAWLSWDSLIIRGVGGPLLPTGMQPLSPTELSCLWAEGAACGFAHPAC